MKVMHVMAGAPTGGAENIFLESVLALADAGLEQCVVTRDNNDFRLKCFRDKGIETRTASFHNYFRWTTNRVIADAVKEFGPDVIEYWMGRAGTFAYVAKSGKQPVNVGWYGGYYKRERFKNCPYHVGLTKDLIRHIKEQGVDDAHAALIHTYAEFEEATPTNRATLDTPEDAPVLLALARLHWKKGLDVLLEAIAKVPGAYLWIAGEGPLEIELKKQSSDLGLDDRVRFLGWRDDRGALLAASDICVFPSRYEPFGTVTVDAWAAKTPLIATAAQGPKAYVDNEVNGLLLEIDDTEGLTEAIRRVINDKELREKIVSGGTRTYEDQFTKEVFVRDSLEFYNRVTKSAP